MEFVVLAVFAALAATFIGLPRGAVAPSVVSDDGLRERRSRLLRELQDLDDDASEGRISTNDRVEGRRALAPELRAVTEVLRERGDTREHAPTGGRS